MASLAGQEEAFNSTNDSGNRQRLARLLICGGERLLTEKFGSIRTSISISNLTLRLLSILRIRMDSESVDLMMMLLMSETSYGLTRPLTGWHSLPQSEDYSLEADLARIRYHCELECWYHKDPDILTDAEFDYFWREISETFLRIAASISPEKRNEWQISIDGFLRDPLKLSEQNKYVEKLRWWSLSKTLKDIGDKLLLLGK